MEKWVCRAGKKIHIFFILNIFSLKNAGLNFYSYKMIFCCEHMQVKEQIITGTLQSHKNLSHQFQLCSSTG